MERVLDNRDLLTNVFLTWAERNNVIGPGETMINPGEEEDNYGAAVLTQFQAWKAVSQFWCTVLRDTLVTHPKFECTLWHRMLNEPWVRMLPMQCLLSAWCDFDGHCMHDARKLGDGYVLATLLDADLVYETDHYMITVKSLAIRVGDAVYDNAWTPLAQAGLLSRKHLRRGELYCVTLVEQAGSKLYEVARLGQLDLPVMEDEYRFELRRPSGEMACRQVSWSTWHDLQVGR